MKKNILVFPCGSEIGLEIHKSLSLSTHIELYGGSSASDHGEFVYRNYIDNLPFIDDPNFVDKLNDVIERYKIDFIFPAHDSVVLKLAQESSKGTVKCKILTSLAEACEIARSKLKTYQTLKDVIAIPKIYENVQQLTAEDFPIFLKPDVGQGSKGTYKAQTVEDVEFYVKKDPSLLLLEYLPGKEYTIDCFTDKTGALAFSEGRERQRIANGISVRSGTVDDPRFHELAAAINDKITFRGAWFFQVKENEHSEYVLMEIAPRIAGTMGLVRSKGVNLPLLTVFDAMDYDVEIFENDYTMVIDRALQNSYRHNIKYGHVYMDFDDTVIFEGKVNPQIVAFIYQCINKGVKIHLLTRHRDNLVETLEKYRMSNMFDEVNWMKDDTKPKSSYILEKNAIFIDDSFAERKEAKDSLGIPVFDTHMIESLMK